MNRKELLAAYKAMGKNFMTPRVLAKRVLVSKRTVIELASGTGFTGNAIFGVSVMQFDETGKRVFPKPDQSAMFHDLESARSHYSDIDAPIPV